MWALFFVLYIAAPLTLPLAVDLRSNKLDEAPTYLCDVPQWWAWSHTVRNTLHTVDLLEHLTSMGPLFRLLLAPLQFEEAPLTWWQLPLRCQPTTSPCSSPDALMTIRSIEWLTQCLCEQLIMEVGTLPIVAVMLTHLSKRFQQRSSAQSAHLSLQAWTTRHAGVPSSSTLVACC